MASEQNQIIRVLKTHFEKGDFKEPCIAATGNVVADKICPKEDDLEVVDTTAQFENLQQ